MQNKEQENPKPRPPFSRMDEDYIERAFTYHKPMGDQGVRYTEINSYAALCARTILQYCPESAERTLAIRALQEARMWANASIAINGAEDK